MRTVHAAATAEAPCTCGELVQGVIEGEPFLVSCPIDRYSRVRVELGGNPAGAFAPSKALRAVEATLELLGRRGVPFGIEVTCPLPHSKGFGTSTADVTAAIVAASAAGGEELAPADIARLAVSIEPSDGTMFPGLALFNHRSARRGTLLGGAPPLLVAVLEFEGAVDTLEYNARLDLACLLSREREHLRALDLLRRGLEEPRWELVGQAATLSATINQAVLPKPGLEEAIRLGDEHGALGVCAAHSGVVLGVLFAPDGLHAARALLEAASGRLPGLEGGWLTRMASGGPRIVSAQAPANIDQVPVQMRSN